MKTSLTITITALLAASAGWFFASRGPRDAGSAGTERKPLFYQSAMHPWIKSDKPGRCTICGMELTPVYPGDKGFDESGGDEIVALTQSQIQVLQVQTATAATRPLVRSLPVSGTIDDDATRHRVLSAYLDGRIDKLHLNVVGTEVAAGQALADFYSPTLLQAEREYRQLKGELRELTGLRLRQMGLTPEQITALNSKPADSLVSPILSPISGTVVSQSVYEGQYVSTGQALFEIADFSTMWFMFLAYEQDLPWIRPGLTVRVNTPSIPGKSFNGTITFIDPNLDETTRAAKVRVELPNPIINGRRELFHRLYAEGMVELEAPAVLTVPRSAVIQTGPDAVVYIDRGDGAYAHTPVRIGRRGDSHVEVLSGLKEGDAVVTNGNLLIDGQAEMNRAFMTPQETNTAAVATKELTEAQQQDLETFLKTADAMAAALAADDLAAFNKASEPAIDATGALIRFGRELFPKGPPANADPHAALDTLDQARHFHGFADLKSARAAFHRFSVAATAVMEPLRAAGLTPAFEIYECGMVDESIPGVQPKARWFQTGKRPLANPFFGAAMLECGKEIKP